MDRQQWIVLLTAAAAFGLVFSLWLVAVLAWSGKRRAQSDRIAGRMGLAPQQVGQGRVIRLWHDGKEATTLVPGLPQKRNFMERFDIMRMDAGWQTPAQTLMLGLSAGTLLAFVLSYLITSSLLVSICAGASVLMGFSIVIKQSISKRSSLFERQLVDALELAARSLRVGQPLVGSFSLISEEIAAPVGPLFAAICQQQGMGMGLDEAIRVASEQSGSQDMKFFATSVVIQLRSGGNLADMMERLAFVIRDRMRLARRVRVLTAQTQFSKRVLQALPFIVFVVLSLINPEYMQPLYTTSAGKLVLGAAAAGLLAGTWTMNRLAVIKY